MSEVKPDKSERVDGEVIRELSSSLAAGGCGFFGVIVFGFPVCYCFYRLYSLRERYTGPSVSPLAAVLETIGLLLLGVLLLVPLTFCVNGLKAFFKSTGWKYVLDQDRVQLIDQKSEVVGQVPYDNIAGVESDEGCGRGIRLVDPETPDTFWPVKDAESPEERAWIRDTDGVWLSLDYPEGFDSEELYEKLLAKWNERKLSSQESA